MEVVFHWKTLEYRLNAQRIDDLMRNCAGHWKLHVYNGNQHGYDDWVCYDIHRGTNRDTGMAMAANAHNNNNTNGKHDNESTREVTVFHHIYKYIKSGLFVSNHFHLQLHTYRYQTPCVLLPIEYNASIRRKEM